MFSRQFGCLKANFGQFTRRQLPLIDGYHVATCFQPKSHCESRLNILETHPDTAKYRK